MSRDAFTTRPSPTIYLLATEAVCRRPLLDTVRRALGAGVAAVQMREKGLAPGAALERALALRRLCEDHGALFVVNDDPVLAARCGAAGLHLGQDDAAPAAARRLVGEDVAIGLSTHDAAQVRAAADDPEVDLIGIGPVFSTATKDAGAPIGPDPAGRAVRLLEPRRAVFAIGGIAPGNAALLAAAGCTRVAVSAAVLAAPDPAAAVAALRDALART